MIPLIKELLKRQRNSTIWWIVGLGLTVVLIVYLYPSMGVSEELYELLDQLPPAMQLIVGENLVFGTLEGWLQLEFLAWLPLVMAIYAGLFLTSSISKEADQRTLEYIFSLPIKRETFLFSRYLVGAINIFIILAASWLIMILSVYAIGESISLTNTALAVFNSYLVTMAIFSLVFPVTALIDDQGKGSAIVLSSIFISYLVAIILRAADTFVEAAWLIPFDHHAVGDVLASKGIPWVSIAYLVFLSLLGLSLAVWVYRKRDFAF